MKKFKILAVVLVVLFAFMALVVFTNSQNKEQKKTIVSVSSFFLYDIAKHIAADTIDLFTILPFGTDPHSFELTPKIMANIEKSSLVFYSGAGLEPWISRINFHSKAVDVSKYVKLRELGSDEFEFHKHHDSQCSHNRLDPHYWLDFDNMKEAVYLITQELIKIEPSHTRMYIINRDIYIKMLQKLDQKYKIALSTCAINSVILNHNSLGYLAKRYNFHAESLSGLSPEAQPTPNDIKRIMLKIKADGVKSIFFENFVNSKVIESIAKDTHVKIETISPLGNITANQAKAGKTYERLMLQNLEKLSKALMCH